MDFNHATAANVEGLTAIGVLAFGAVGLAAVAQHVFDIQPCPWCAFQRLLYIVVGVLASLAAVLSNTSRRTLIVLACLGAPGGIASVRENSCALMLAESIISALRLDWLVPRLFVAYASCADASVSGFHISFAIWNCAMFVIFALLLVWTLRRSMKGKALVIPS